MDINNVKDIKGHVSGTKPLPTSLPPKGYAVATEPRPAAPPKAPEKPPTVTEPYYHFDWRDYRADDDPPGFNKFITDAVGNYCGTTVSIQAIINRKTKTITIFSKKNYRVKTTYSLHGFGKEYDDIQTLGNNWLNDKEFKAADVQYIAPKRNWQ